MQLLVTLTPERQPVATVAKDLRMTKSQLAKVIKQHRTALEAQGMQLHSATPSTIGQAIKLPSIADSAAPSYYSQISKEQPREP